MAIYTQNTTDEKINTSPLNTLSKTKEQYGCR